MKQKIKLIVIRNQFDYCLKLTFKYFLRFLPRGEGQIRGFFFSS